MISRVDNPTVNRRFRASDAPLSARQAALVRESWWLLVVAAVAFLTLILATYHRSDPGWSYSGGGLVVLNRGGVVGAWVADVLLYLFGFSAWWCVFAGIVLVVAGYRRVATHADPSRERHHPWLAVPGFLLLLCASSALEALRLYRLPATLPQAPGGAIGDLIDRKSVV